MSEDGADGRLTLKLIDSLYAETMSLVDQVRAYFDEAGRAERDRLDPMVRVSFSCESLRVTTRLMHIVAWLMTRRAVEAGEIDAAVGRETQRRVGAATESDGEAIARLPQRAQALIRASTELYERVGRLDQELDSDVAAMSPVRNLLQRLEGAF